MNSWWKTEQVSFLVCQKWLSFEEVWIDPWVSLFIHGKAVGKLCFRKKTRWWRWIVARVLFKYNSNILFYILFIGCIHVTSQARGSAGKWFCWQTKGLRFKPSKDQNIFLTLVFFSFVLTNFNNLIHLSKLLILRWFFAHLSFNMSILWLCKKIPKIFYFWLFFI